LANLLGIPELTAFNWTVNPHIPSLGYLLKLGYCIEVFFLNLVCGRMPTRSLYAQVIFKPNKQSEPKFVLKYDLETTRAVLKESLCNTPPLSLNSNSKIVGFSAFTLKRHFPELCTIILQRFNIYRNQEILKRKEFCNNELNEIISNLYGKGVLPTYGNVTPLFTFPGFLRSKEGKAEFQNLRRLLKPHDFWKAF
jgi:hypothetical protein